MEQGLAITNASRARDAPVNLQASLNVRRGYGEGALDLRAAPV